jgi:hypothetical protein
MERVGLLMHFRGSASERALPLDGALRPLCDSLDVIVVLHSTARDEQRVRLEIASCLLCRTRAGGGSRCLVASYGLLLGGALLNAAVECARQRVALKDPIDRADFFDNEDP